MNEIPDNAVLLIYEQHGIYMPKLFANMFPEHFFFDELEVMRKGPDHADYWDIWEDILDREFLHPEDGRGALYQDGDLWFIPYSDESL